eukprot:TRINITY_DN680_c0_g1_i4.p1 TRINITY_DN680_c0_g1~~TRINITY_DN680_c0_g1_i4.p1  ORF type:complete len:505 (-),score=70.90 TRINITY_DN680_c0_g1_i4:297-1811(-)
MKGKKQSLFIGRKVPLVENGVPILYKRYTKLSDLGIESGEDSSDDELQTEHRSNGHVEVTNLQETNIQNTQEKYVNFWEDVPPVQKRKKQKTNDQEQQKTAKFERQSVSREVQDNEDDVTDGKQDENEKEDLKVQKQKEKKQKKKKKKVEADEQRIEVEQCDNILEKSTEQFSLNEDKLEEEHIDLSDQIDTDEEEEEEGKVIQDNKGKDKAGNAQGRISGEGNYEQAIRMRETLSLKPGINKSARTVKPFSFNFQVRQQPDAAEDDSVEINASTTKHQIIQPKENYQQPQNEEVKQYVPRRVYVGGMPFSWTENDVKEYWEYCGEIEDISLTQFEDTGRFKGIAFITFKTEKSYEDALQYDGEDCEGFKLRVKPCDSTGNNQKSYNNGQQQRQQYQQQQQPSRYSNSRSKSTFKPRKVEGYNAAYVGNLDYSLSKEQILEYFKPCGAVSVKLHTDQRTGEPKGFAHVFFENGDQLDRAIQLDESELGGREIIVRYGQPKKKNR